MSERCIDCDEPLPACSCEGRLRCSCGIPDEVCVCAGNRLTRENEKMESEPKNAQQLAADKTLDIYADLIEKAGGEVVAAALLVHVEIAGEESGGGTFLGLGDETEVFDFLIEALRNIGDRMGLDVRLVPVGQG